MARMINKEIKEIENQIVMKMTEKDVSTLD
jgi:hypothetical protein